MHTSTRPAETCYASPQHDRTDTGEAAATRRRRLGSTPLPVALAVVLLAVTVLVAITNTPTPAAASTGTTARQLLATLPVRAEVTTGYDRTLFPHWLDADRDCQNTRAEVLIAETRVPVTFTSTSRCTVATGSWYSWYDARTWTTASSVDIDHVVALKEAWDSGASTWTTTRRGAYANDLGFAGSLEAVTDTVNQSKSDKDPAEWLPPVTAVNCRYAITWVQVKYRWQLSVDATEQRALNALLTGSCGDTVITVPARP